MKIVWNNLNLSKRIPCFFLNSRPTFWRNAKKKIWFFAWNFPCRVPNMQVVAKITFLKELFACFSLKKWHEWLNCLWLAILKPHQDRCHHSLSIFSAIYGMRVLNEHQKNLFFRVLLLVSCRALNFLCLSPISQYQQFEMENYHRKFQPSDEISVCILDFTLIA